MKPLIILGMLALSMLPALGAANTPPTGESAIDEHAIDGAAADQAAQSLDAGAVADSPTAESDSAPASGVGPHAADAIDLEAQLYHSRPLVIFADNPENPDFVRQLQLIGRDLDALAERRVVVVIDSDPAARTEWRQRLRPNGFSLVLLDTDLRPVIRKPSPWDVREISRTIDRLPSRRQDLSRQFPSGR